MQSLRALKPKSNWFGFVTFIVQELLSEFVLAVLGHFSAYYIRNT